ncbi:rhomboid family intramembrane serine protease [Maribellus comscasis]|uniref:Rhomboid family intramembrane serine protease n=1 Tax=Maribellus comscasis TaxID=2681766 RepID=A0A6I6K1A3_9BACT|nr:rhomboid family intramembrane serine protease [Maribellus comscasis]QGY43704.1 rhomboid family intramembrane serine protease [Maribellus comscasis]
MNYRPVLNNIPPVVKNLIIINVLFMLATWVFKNMGIDMVEIFGMHYPGSDKFMLHQVITYMFMHGGFTHILFNMFALWMFGRVLESVWGPKRFLMYYMITGIGAIALHTLISYFEISAMQNTIQAFQNTPSPEILDQFVQKNLPNSSVQVRDFVNSWYDDPTNNAFAGEGLNLMQRILQMKMDIPTVGASGAVFGILLAFGMLFPNTQLMLLFPPIPIKAKYFVIGYGLVELYLGLAQPGSNVAHFAHLGGMLFGFILIKYWNKNSRHFY